jgi:D-amino-acid dehydrogenase
VRVLVLGAGVIGTTTAYYLARDGHEVVVVDRQPGAALETSFANAGMITPGHAYTWASPRAPSILIQSLFRNDTALKFRFRLDPELWSWSLKFLRECTASRAAANTAHKVRLCLYSLSLFDELNRTEPIAYDHHKHGSLFLYRDREHLERAIAATSVLTRNGVPLEPVTPERSAEIEPALSGEKGGLAGAIYCPIDETGDCHKFTTALAARLGSERNVALHFGTEILRIVSDGARVREVVTSKGAFTADAYVLALGSYAPGLARSLGIRLPVYPVKGYSLTIPVGETNRAPQVMGVDEKYLIAWSRLGDRLRVTAKADFAGFDRSHTPADFEHMLATIRKLFPEGAAYDKAEHWAGLRPMTPRGTPILGASPLRNLFLNTGHGHMGWTMSLGSARIVSDLVAGRSPAITLAGLTPADAM